MVALILLPLGETLLDQVEAVDDSHNVLHIPNTESEVESSLQMLTK